MSERKRVKRNIEFTDDISETGLTKEQFNILSEHYENNDNIIQDRDTTPVLTPRQKLAQRFGHKGPGGKTLVKARGTGTPFTFEVLAAPVDEAIVDVLSSRNHLKPNVVRKLLSEYEALKTKETV